jgi:hypothetical protein
MGSPIAFTTTCSCAPLVKLLRTAGTDESRDALWLLPRKVHPPSLRSSVDEAASFKFTDAALDEIAGKSNVVMINGDCEFG